MTITEGAIELNQEKIGKVLVFRFKGRLDAISSPVAENSVLASIDKGETQLLFDLGGVGYLSSAGMRMFLSTTKKLKGLSGQLVLCCLTPNVMDVVKMSGFDRVLELSDKVEEGLKKFK